MGAVSSIPLPDNSSVHDFTVKDSKGNDVDLSIYKGKVLLIVNVASKCRLTNSNYTQLTELYRKYKDKEDGSIENNNYCENARTVLDQSFHKGILGFEILAFPCNQFLQQEPGTIEETVEFVCERFKAEYPIFGKVKVNGNNATPLYKYLKANGGGYLGTTIKWNFTKFLISKKGKVIRRFKSITEPSTIEEDIEKALEEPNEDRRI